MNVWDVGVLALVLALIVILIWLMVRAWWPSPTQHSSVPYGCTDEMWWLWQQLYALEPSTKLGGVYASKPGYHNMRQNLPGWDYSVCDQPPDGGGPANMAAAIDWTFPDAQGGNYNRIAKYTKRLLASAQDPDDSRLNGWREFYGNADDDSYVEGWDIRYGCAATSDSSHLWHIHISEDRDMTTSRYNKEALLSVLKGETWEQWLDIGVKGDGAVLLNCPYDDNRLDLFLVGADRNVVHRWWYGGMDTAWSGSGVKSENLGGTVEVGTLTAAWTPDEKSLNIAGLGQGDAKTPAGCGMYWGMNLNKDGKRSGWGSLEGAYGKLPATTTSTVQVQAIAAYDQRAMAVAIIADVLAIFAIVYAAWGPR